MIKLPVFNQKRLYHDVSNNQLFKVGNEASAVAWIFPICIVIFSIRYCFAVIF